MDGISPLQMRRISMVLHQLVQKWSINYSNWKGPLKELLNTSRLRKTWASAIVKFLVSLSMHILCVALILVMQWFSFPGSQLLQPENTILLSRVCASICIVQRIGDLYIGAWLLLPLSLLSIWSNYYPTLISWKYLLPQACWLCGCCACHRYRKATIHYRLGILL